MQKFFEVALIEGQGLGTAYEYYVKRRVLNKAVKEKGINGSVCVYGIPEKNGTSMDFCLFAGEQGASKVVVMEDIVENAARCRNSVKELEKAGHLKDSYVVLEADMGLSDKKFGLTMNCDVFQRFKLEDTVDRIVNATKRSDLCIFFMPNGWNASRKKDTEKKSLLPEDVLNGIDGRAVVLKWDYIDMPPFPPGSKKNAGPLSLIGLKLWSLIERLTPRTIRKNYSHAFYVMVKAVK